MTTVLGESHQLSIPEELARMAGLHAGSRVEVTATSEGVLVRPSKLTNDQKLAVLDSLEGEGRRRLPHVRDQVEALQQDRAADDRLDLEDELA